MTDLLERFTDSERERLVRLCAHFTGNIDAAEDLAQEALIEAWRNAAKLRDPQGRDRWLAAIARNVCLRWTRRNGRAQARLAPAAAWDEPADSLDLESELERNELGHLLDRALGLLPDDTRAVLVAAYVDELPGSEIATRFAISEGAASMRLSRGKRALRKVLTSELREEAQAFGLLDPSAAGWQETRIWCPKCGACRLLIRQEAAPGTISFRCPVCNPEQANASVFRLTNRYFANLLGTLRQPRRIERRVAEWGYGYYQRALRERQAACTNCGQSLPLRTAAQDALLPTSTLALEPVFYVACPHCREVCSTSLTGLMQSHPAFQHFWEEHGRVRAVSYDEIEAGGRQAIVLGYESVNRRATLDILVAQASFEVLAVHAAAGTNSA